MQVRLTRRISVVFLVLLLTKFMGMEAGAAGQPEATPAGGKNAPALWSLQPVKLPALPKVEHTHWSRNPIDSFILAQLEKAGLSPAPEADRATLIRRLSFDLLGLPPAPGEIKAFLKDKSPQAYEKLVDHLLASPHYGERWGRHWLDVARYTESQGFEYDRLRDNAWQYRDYVIASFNQDKPYDRFIKEQIAGDVLDPVTREGIIGTSLLVCGPWDEAGNNQANATQKAITREEEMEDLVSVVCQSFLGMTVNCARCHAHKFDPIPQEDYYRIKSVFDGVRHGESPILPPEEVRRRDGRIAILKERISGLTNQLTELEQKARVLVLAQRQEQNRLKAGPGSPLPLAAWTFDSEGRDNAGGLPGELQGGASISHGCLVLNGTDAYLKTAALAKDVREKTLEARVSLPTLNQGGGGVISVQSKDGGVFDAIVFGERKRKKWMAGSNGYQRTRDVAGPDETAPPGEVIQVAIVYRADNSITVYRNGKVYGEPYTPDHPLQTYKAGEARVVIGLRHTGGANAFLKGEIEEAALYDRALTAQEVEAMFASPGKPVTKEDLLAVMTPTERAHHADLAAVLDKTRKELGDVPPLPVSYVGIRKQPAPTHRLKRGDVKSPLEEVRPGGLSAITELTSDFGLAADSPEAQRRLKFAAWLADPRNPLTPRVMVNRLWHYHFGQGIVPTPNDFGNSGVKPVNPELLDWLAATFVQQGWSVKAMQRLIVCSAAYRQSSALSEAATKIDADDQLLWRYSPRRLEAEEVRDAMLAVSGELNAAEGGPSFRPFQVIQFGSSTYVPVDKTGPDYDRRTVYRINVNSGKEPLLDALDCPEPSIKTPRRNVTTTPLQALGLMNDTFVLRQAEHLSSRALAESNGNLPEAIGTAYRLTLGRPPSKAEVSRAVTAARERGLNHVCWALLNSTEFLYVR